MSSCETCTQLWSLFANPKPEKQTIDLGSFDKALTSKCPDHTKIIEAFQIACRTGQQIYQRSDDVGFTGAPESRSITLTESVERLGRTWHLIAANRPDIENHPGKGRVLDSDWVDLGRVLEWKRMCCSGHGDKCENPMKIAPASPAWLVDVENKCIVPGDGKPYIALSCRSSGEDAYRLHEDDLEALQKRGALDNTEFLGQLPLKIQHAIKLTKALDERYLWADTLCIDHSNRTATSAELNLMTAIYAGATFTIIAADGDRLDGINGLKDISEPRNLAQKVFAIGEEQILVRNTGIFSLDHFNTYHDRGWTYQEFKMSPRKLIFMKNEVHWLCNSSVWHEELTLGSEVDKYIDPRPQVLSAGSPDLDALGHMLADYNNRALTYDEDALAAITGLLTVFSRSFPGGFLYGLPETFLDRALAWRPQWDLTTLKRRQISNKPSHIGFTATDLPSWSWVGWQGMFSLQYGEAARVNDIQYYIEETTPITEWYTSSAPADKPKRRIRSTWFEDRARRKDIDQPLPKGWERSPAPKRGEWRDEPMLYPDACGEYLYQHDKEPEGENKLWYYPFEIPDIETSTPYFVPEQTRYLFCKTWKASLWAHRVVHEDVDEGNHVLVLRLDVGGRKIGTLHLQTDEQMNRWPEPTTKDEDEVGREGGMGRRVEVVAINECVKHSKTFDEEKGCYGLPIKREERVTVLWVEWEDGVAYRLACGYVEKEAWEGLEPEEVDLVLG